MIVGFELGPQIQMKEHGQMAHQKCVCAVVIYAAGGTRVAATMICGIAFTTALSCS